MNRLIPLLLLALLSACTGHLYVGNTSFVDDDQRCTATTYWYKTDYLIGSKSDRFLTVLSGGERRSIEYKERDGEVLFIGDKGRDVMVIGEPPSGDKLRCGWIENLTEVGQFEGNELTLHIHCRAKTDSLSKAKKGYLTAREEPYRFTIHHAELKSLTGKLPDPPRPPTCTPLTP